MILGLTLCYGVIKFIDLYEGNDPNIRQNNKVNFIEPKDTMTFANDINFRMAVGIKRQGEQTLAYDPQVGRLFAMMTTQSIWDNTLSYKYFPMHDCTEEDYKDFFPLQ